MITISAFADEISPDPQEQINVLKSCRVRHIEFRSILKTNVLNLTDLQIQEFKSLLDREGFRLSAIGSPIGKIRIDEPFEPHLLRLERAIQLCKIFDTPNIRIFSYYPPTMSDWDEVEESYKQEMFQRMQRKIEVAEKAGVRLLHENEHKIYGESPENVHELLSKFSGPAFSGVYDMANYVFGGYDPWKGWELNAPYTSHLHIKDWKAGAEHGAIPGEGDGQVERVMADAVKRGYSGFATMEPHLLGGGPTGGWTGPELFPQAVAAYQAILERVGAAYQ